MIIRADKQEELAGRDIREGQGDAFSKLLVKNRMKEKSSIVAIARNRLPAGSSWGERQQHNTEEIFYVLEGQATVVYQGNAEQLSPGDLVLASHGETLALRNEGPEELVFLCLMLSHPKAVQGGFLSTGSTPYSRL